MAEKTSIVLELQALATDAEVEVSDLLRKALLVATKLGLKEPMTWIQQELNGYQGEQKVPEYRQLRAQLRLKNPYHGLVPFVIDSQSIMDAICDVPSLQSIGELTALLRDNARHDFIQITFPPSQLQSLMELQGDFPLEPVRTVAANQIARILDSVRNRVLEWSLQLEAEGVLGYGMTFTSEEKRKAASSAAVTHITTGSLVMGDNYSAGQAGAIGPKAHAHDMTFQQIWNQSSDKLDLKQLATELATLRGALRKEAVEDDHVLALGEVAAAEKAAKAGNGPAALEHLKAAGKWAFDVATKIGVNVASNAIKTSLGI